MYSVYGDGICIYRDLNSIGAMNALAPKLTLADNTAGTLEITLPVGNVGYEKLKRLSSEIVVKRDEEEIWAGRIIKEKKNFQNSRILTCEGELAYFNDTTQPPAEYNEIDIYDLVEALLDVHNSKVGENKQIEIGSITVHGTISLITNNETTMDTICDYLIDKLGGHVRIRRVYDDEGVLHKYFDYLADYPNTNGQTIRFGKNLLDYTHNWDMSEYATVVMPKGAKLNESTIESVDAYLDVSSVNGGSRYVFNDGLWEWDPFDFKDGIIPNNTVEMYGWLEVVVEWEDITDPSELLQKAKDYLTANQFADMSIEISAVDLHYLSRNAQPINLLDNVRCISAPHGMDKIFPVTKLSIQFDSPENSMYTLGDTAKESSLTSSTRDANTAILERISKIPNEQTILDKAKNNATSILNMATQGYVTIIKNEEGSECLTISSENANDAYNPSTGMWKDDTRLWKWSIEGLGYSKDGGQNYEVAITMDGAIVADYITAGTMSADRIRTGVLEDEKGNTKWDLTTGVLTMKKGSISLGVSSSYPNGRFSVDDYGYLAAEYGKIGGFVISSDSIYNDVITLNKAGLYFYIDNKEVGYFSSRHWVDYPSVKGITMDIGTETSYIAWEQYNQITKSYETKFLYAAEEFQFNEDYKTKPDSFIISAPIDLRLSSGFMFYESTRIRDFDYTSVTLRSGITGSGTADKIRLNAASGNKYYDVYVCNGIIMI